LICEGPADLSWLNVRLRSFSGPDEPSKVPVDPDGSFVIRNVPPGSYMLYVLDRHGNEITSQPLNVLEAMPAVAIRLPGRVAARPTGKTVSAARLLHKPDKRALRAAIKAQKLAQEHDYQEAAAELENAVRIDPKFAEAHNNLGVQYLRLGRYGDAAAAFRRAIEIDPTGREQQANLAVALKRIGR
jgi:tetratricopeptide (TPR) repeat protein